MPEIKEPRTRTIGALADVSTMPSVEDVYDEMAACLALSEEMAKLAKPKADIWAKAVERLNARLAA